MGRAIVREPQVFLMDEPLSNLDAKLRVQTRAEIAALQNRLGITTVYVTHDQVEAMTMGDRVAVLKDGILQQADTPADLYDHPDNVFVAGFIGSPAMNLQTVPVDGEDAMFGNLRVPLPPDALQSYRQAGVKEVTLGVRPESFEVAGEDGEPVHVDVVEELGSDAFVYGRVVLATARSASRSATTRVVPRPRATRSSSRSARTSCTCSTRRRAHASAHNPDRDESPGIDAGALVSSGRGATTRRPPRAREGGSRACA
jgi:multiple sugar transport system ATP-binding protein